MDFSSVIKERRAKLQISQIDLSEISGVSLCTIKDIERGKGNPSLSVISKLCEALGLEIKFELRKVVD